MARDFNIEDEDIETWFDEQKELLTNKYLSLIDKKKRKFKSEDEEEKNVKLLDKSSFEIKMNFVAQMIQLRDDYHKRHHKLLRAKESFKRKQKIKSFMLHPFRSILRLIYAEFFLFGIKMKKSTKNFTVFIADVKKFFVNIIYNSRQFFFFRIRPHFSFLFVPYKRVCIFLIRPVKKLIARIMETKKSLIESASKKIKKIIEVCTKIFKKVRAVVEKRYKKVADIFGKFFGRINAVKKKISEKLEQMFPKKEDDD